MDMKNLCYCNKPAWTLTDFKKNVVIRKCPTTRVNIIDIKFVKTGSQGYTGLEIVKSDKEGVPCDYYHEIKLPSRKKRSWVKKWLMFYKGLNIIKNKAILDRETALGDGDVFKKTIETLVQKVEVRRSTNPMTWEIVDKLNYYAIQHLLIEPWRMSGENKETFEEFFERFKNQPPIDKSHVLYKRKYDKFVENKRNKPRIREKSLQILELFPLVQAQAKKSFKKMEKRQRQEEEASRRGVDLQIEQFEKIYNNQSDRTYLLYRSEENGDEENIDYINDIKDLDCDNDSEDSESEASSKDEEDLEEEDEDPEEFDNEMDEDFGEDDNLEY